MFERKKRYFTNENYRQRRMSVRESLETRSSRRLPSINWVDAFGNMVAAVEEINIYFEEKDAVIGGILCH